MGYLDIAGEIQKIVSVSMLTINLLRQELDRVFVRNVFDHESGALVLPDALSLDAEVVQRQLTHA